MHIHKFHSNRTWQSPAEEGITSGGLGHGFALASSGHRSLASTLNETKSLHPVGAGCVGGLSQTNNQYMNHKRMTQASNRYISSRAYCKTKPKGVAPQECICNE